MVSHLQLHAASAAVLTLLHVALPQIENGYNEFEGQTVVDLGCGTVRHWMAQARVCFGVWLRSIVLMRPHKSL